MAIELSINGLFDITILNYTTGIEVENDVEKVILDNLQKGDYVIGISERLIHDLKDLQTPLYRFSLDATDVLDYEFDKI